VLITTCTHCLARFRVSPQQLNAKQGQVRCGRCRKVFNGFEALERYPDDDTGSRLLAAREATLRQSHPPERSESIPLDDAIEIEPPVSLGSVPEEAPAPIAPSPPYVAPSPPPVPAPAPHATPTPHPVPQEGGPTSKPLDSKPLDPKPRRSGPIVYEVERTARKPLSPAWRYAAALIGVVLAIEILFATRAELAQRYPVLRPWLESACSPFRCTVPWPNNEALLKLEDSELLEVPGKPNQIALGARIRNLAPNAQEYPYLELTLTDVSGQAAARRVIRPTDYLGRPVNAGEVLSAGSEFAIQLRLETRSLKATGYELMLFYP
jgi:predicted Zn finger-like uncharacterized protein